MTLTLEQYCAKYGYELIEEYTTWGEERGPHKRARVKDKKSGEEYRLYYDPTSKRPKPQFDEEGMFVGYTKPNPRGWRNITKDNRNSADRFVCIDCEGTGEILGPTCYVCLGKGYVRGKDIR